MPTVKFTAHPFVPPYLEEARERMEAYVAHIDIGSPPDRYVQYDLSPAAIVNMLPVGGPMGVTMNLLVIPDYAVHVVVEVEYLGKGPAAEDVRPFIDMFRRDTFAIVGRGRNFGFQIIIERPLS